MMIRSGGKSLPEEKEEGETIAMGKDQGMRDYRPRHSAAERSLETWVGRRASAEIQLGPVVGSTTGGKQ